MRLELNEGYELARSAAMATGADTRTAESLAKATVAAEIAGRPAVGFAHLPDYLDAFRAGRIACAAQPQMQYPPPTTIKVDAKTGIGQLGFDIAFNRFVDTTEQYGVGLFLQANSYTVGELGYYTRRLAHAGLLCFASSNGPALVTTAGSNEPVYGTNPFSFAAPVTGERPVVLDQSSSATAFVNIRDAATRGASIPEAWAVDATGAPTTDARAALSGMLLAFGGERGANIALMVEILSAGMTGANWSLDAPSFQDGHQSPGVGLFLVAISPKVLIPDFSSRLAAHLDRLRSKGIYVPGQRPERDYIEIPTELFRCIKEY